MRWLPLPLLIVLVACGSSPARPTPPPPVAVTITGSITDTVTGAAIGTFTHEAAGLPAFVAVSAPGYVTRGAWIATARPTVDLIPEAGFDLGFYRQLTRGALEGRMDALRVLSAAPSIYLQTAGLSGATVAALEEAARVAVPALTGGRFQVTTWETGAVVRAPAVGWLVVDVIADEAANCGLTLIGASAGHMWLNVVLRCAHAGYQVDPPLFAHELGHALGFFHVADVGHLMHPRATFTERTSLEPSALERHHGALAYKRSTGNLDVDTDARNAEIFSAARVVVD